MEFGFTLQLTALLHLFIHIRDEASMEATGNWQVHSLNDQCGDSMGEPQTEVRAYPVCHGRVFGVDHKSIQLQNPSTTLPIIDYVPTGAQYSGEVHLNVNVVERTPHVQVRHSGVAQALCDLFSMC